MCDAGIRRVEVDASMLQRPTPVNSGSGDCGCQCLYGVLTP